MFIYARFYVHAAQFEFSYCPRRGVGKHGKAEIGDSRQAGKYIDINAAMLAVLGDSVGRIGL